MKPIIRLVFVVSVVTMGLAVTSRAQSQVAVSTGYNDEPQFGASYGPTSDQPIPWIGSPDTVFYSNPAIDSTSYDPDQDAILLQNLGTSPIDLTAASIVGEYNLFALDDITGPVVLAPGVNVILAGPDGSDVLPATLQTVGLTIGGTSYSYSDVTTAEAPYGVLYGASPWIGGSETQPWTSIYTPPTSSSVPDASSTMLLSGIALSSLAAFRRRFAK